MNRDKTLEKVKLSTFIGSNAAFLGCLMCQYSFKWSKDIETACITEDSFLWNPDWFDSLSFRDQKFVLLHELWHIALLHKERMGTRDMHKWNIACDYRINASLYKELKYMPQGGIVNLKYCDDSWTEEDIYNDLGNGNPSQASWGTVLKPVGQNESLSTVTKVQNAVSSAKLAGCSDSNVERALKNFLKPLISWREVLNEYLLEKIEPDYSWSRPNRRFRDCYLPSFTPQDEGLVSVAMFLDTSGSVTEEEIERFVTEVKHIHSEFHPDQLYVIQFNTNIVQVDIFTPYDSIEELTVVGGGGTSFKAVRSYIERVNPKLSLIFTDLYAYPMKETSHEVIWITTTTDPDFQPSFGKVIHVQE